jgi:hypothetical protein
MQINHEIVKGKLSEAKSGLILKLKQQTEVVWESMRLEQVETEEIA